MDCDTCIYIGIDCRFLHDPQEDPGSDCWPSQEHLGYGYEEAGSSYATYREEARRWEDGRDLHTKRPRRRSPTPLLRRISPRAETKSRGIRKSISPTGYRYRKNDGLEDRERQKSSSRDRGAESQMASGSNSRFGNETKVIDRDGNPTTGWDSDSNSAVYGSEISRIPPSGPPPSRVKRRWDPVTKQLVDKNVIEQPSDEQSIHDAVKVNSVIEDRQLPLGYNPGYARPYNDYRSPEYPPVAVENFPGYNPGYAPPSFDFADQSQVPSQDRARSRGTHSVSASQVMEERPRSRRIGNIGNGSKRPVSPAHALDPAGHPDTNIKHQKQLDLPLVQKDNRDKHIRAGQSESIELSPVNPNQSGKLVELRYELPRAGESSNGDSVRDCVLGVEDGQYVYAGVVEKSGATLEISRSRTAIFIHGTAPQVQTAVAMLEAKIHVKWPKWKALVADRSGKVGSSVRNSSSGPVGVEQRVPPSSSPAVTDSLKLQADRPAQSTMISSDASSPSLISKFEPDVSASILGLPEAGAIEEVPPAAATPEEIGASQHYQKNTEAFLRSIVKSRMRETKPSPGPSAVNSVDSFAEAENAGARHAVPVKSGVANNMQPSSRLLCWLLQQMLHL